ncbi:hypothetical protein EBU95_10450 [bacterium]|nr:hypothetical protein [bacterium]
MKRILYFLVITVLHLTLSTESAKAFEQNLRLQFGGNQETFEYSAKTCTKFGTIENIIGDLGDDDKAIPLPNIASKKLFEKVITYSNTPANERLAILKLLPNKDFVELFEALNFLNPQGPEESFGPFIKRIFKDERILQDGEITPEKMRKLMWESPDNVSLIDWFFHPHSGNYNRFTLITHSNLARGSPGQLLKELTEEDPKESTCSPALKNLAALGVIINFRHEQGRQISLTGGYALTHIGITHLPVAEVLKIRIDPEDPSKQRLHLNNNRIADPRTLTIGVCRNLEKLRVLDLSCNCIKIFPALELPHLVSLFLFKNGLTGFADNVFDGVPNLECLSLSDNKITTIPDSLSRLKQLEKLWLQNNPITIIGQLSLPKLTDLNLPELITIPYLTDCHSLRRLTLTSNQLTTAELDLLAQQLPNLQEFNLNLNQFP